MMGEGEGLLDLTYPTGDEGGGLGSFLPAGGWRRKRKRKRNWLIFHKQGGSRGQRGESDLLKRRTKGLNPQFARRESRARKV